MEIEVFAILVNEVGLDKVLEWTYPDFLPCEVIDRVEDYKQCEAVLMNIIWEHLPEEYDVED